MKVGKIISIVVVSIAGLILLGAAVAMIAIFGPSRIRGQQNFAPSEGQQAVSPSGDIVLYSRTSGSSSFLYRQDLASGQRIRLTNAVRGIESEATFSHNGKFVVYAF